MVPIHTKPPSRDYDNGWDRIFGKPDRDATPDVRPETREAPQEEPPTAPDLAPAKRMPRGWTPKSK
jgi:hypothetical protein